MDWQFRSSCWRCDDTPISLFFPKHSAASRLTDRYCECCWRELYHEEPTTLFSVAAHYPELGQKTPTDLEVRVTRLTSKQPFGIIFKKGSSIINDIEPHGPAHRAGLQPGMRITKVDGKSVAQLRHIRAALKEGTTNVFTIARLFEAAEPTVYLAARAVPEIDGPVHRLDQINTDTDLILDSETNERVLHVFPESKADQLGIVPGMKIHRATGDDRSVVSARSTSPCHSAYSSTPQQTCSSSDVSDTCSEASNAPSSLFIHTPLLKRQTGTTVGCGHHIRLDEPIWYNHPETGSSVVDCSDIELVGLRRFGHHKRLEVSISIEKVNNEVVLRARNPTVVEVNKQDHNLALIDDSDLKEILPPEQSSDYLCQHSLECKDDECDYGLHIPDTRFKINKPITVTTLLYHAVTSVKDASTYFTFTTFPYKFNQLSELMRSIEVSVVANPYSRSITFCVNGEKLQPVTSVHLSQQFIRLPEIRRCIRTPSDHHHSEMVLDTVRRMCVYSGVHVNTESQYRTVRVKSTFAITPVSPKVNRDLINRWQQTNHGYPYIAAWEIHNDELDYKVKMTQHNMRLEYGRDVSVVEAYHGTPEANVLSIAKNGFDTSRRAGQVHGAGEYFAKYPTVSIDYCDGGSFLFLCVLLLGDESDYHYVRGCDYYVIKNRERNVQIIPRYIIQFKQHSHWLGSRNAELRKTLRATNGKPQEVINPMCRYRTKQLKMASPTTTVLTILNPLVSLHSRIMPERLEAVKKHLAKHSLTVSKFDTEAIAGWVAYLEASTPCTQLMFMKLNKSVISLEDGCLHEFGVSIPSDDQLLPKPKVAPTQDWGAQDWGDDGW